MPRVASRHEDIVDGIDISEICFFSLQIHLNLSAHTYYNPALQ